jgi:hypothetical protein
MKFDDFFDNSALPRVLKQARTLVKEECREIFSHMSSCKPHTILEFGVQYGCSSRVFVEMAKWLDLKMELNSWDVVDAVKKDCISKTDFKLHIEDVTGKEKEVFDRYSPDLVFLDAHPYRLTKSIMQECLSRKIDFMTHDVEQFVFDRAKKQSKNFTDFSVYVDWELYILGELISKDLYTKDYYENDLLTAKCFRGHGGGGLSIIEFKRGVENVK